jgi:hypothetical protein
MAVRGELDRIIITAGTAQQHHPPQEKLGDNPLRRL